MKTIGSLFAGIGGFDLGFERAGFKTTWACEIDQKAQAVLRLRFPDAKLHDDVCQIGVHNLEPVDVVTFGSPCQDLSVAGKRAGLAGERSGLFHEAVRIIRELRERHGKPDFAIWENVPGAFSSNQGRDFAAVLQALADIGATDLAWRVVDSRFFGVAQRRRRVFLVADFGGERAEQVLALAQGVRGYSPQGRKAREGTAAGAGYSPRTSGAVTSKWAKGGGPAGDEHYNLVATHVPPKAACLETTNHDYSRADGFTAVAFNWQEGPGGTLGMSDADTGGSPPVRVHQTLAVALTDGSPSDTISHHADTKETDTIKVLRDLFKSIGAEAFTEWGFGVLASFFEEEILQQALHGSGFCRQGVRRYELVGYARESKEASATRLVREMWQDGRKGCPSCRWQPHEQRALQLATYLQRLSQPGTQASQVLHDLRSSAKGAWVLRPSLSTVQEMGQSADGQGQRLCACSSGVGEQSDQVMQCVRVLEAIPCKELLRDASSAFASGKSVVRRLTVRECEFLQGFPRNWTSEGITKEGKRIQMADAPRYRQLGNAVTVNVANWIANNLAAVYAAPKESADGEP